jgi:predicted ATP-grasp superfamily ATP-dependent carboligase
MRFTGIAEVEFKWNVAQGEYQLIEINPRLWDQHRLGKSCGTDLVFLAYCEYAGLARPAFIRKVSGHKWIGEDGFVFRALQLLWRRDPKLRSLFRLSRGKRSYAIWSGRDPLPLLAYLATNFIPRVIAIALRVVWSALKTRFTGEVLAQNGGPVYERHLGKEKSRG